MTESSGDDLDWSDLEMISLHAREAIDRVNRGGVCSPQVVVVSLPQESGGSGGSLTILDPHMIDYLQRQADGKVLLMGFVAMVFSEPPEELGLPARPDAVVHVSEAWAVEKKVQAGEPIPASLGEAILQHPDRKEVILIYIYTRARTYMGVCPISGEIPDRSAEFRPISTAEPPPAGLLQ